MDAFLDVKVQPIYGKFRALITWKVEPSLEDASFSILKSHDGVNDWRLIGDVVAADHFVDENLLSQGKLIEQYYRVQAVKQGRSPILSPSIGTFGTVSRDVFGAARRIMEIEYEAMRVFTKVHLFKLRVFAPPCPVCVDPDTEQAIGTSTCTRCFGTQKENGYADPVVTFMRIMTVTPVNQTNSTDGTGAIDPSVQVIRLLAFPMLRQGDLLVHKEADRRYLVNTVDYSFMAGKIPVVAMANVSMLPTTDIRFKVPVP